MKTNNVRAFVAFLGLILTTVVISCKKDDPIPLPVAGFDGVSTGKTVKFTNTTLTGVSYAWDFGDGTSSTEKDPSHTYKANGSFIVKMTATNTSGTNISSKVFDVINVKVDGVMTEWATIPSIIAYKDAEGGTIKEIKMENLGRDKLYVYMKTTNASFQFYDFYINSDNDANTGFASWLYPVSKGIDVLMEGYFTTLDPAQDFFLGSYDDVTSAKDKTAWTWKQLKQTSNFLKTAKVVKGATESEIEFVIDLTEIPSTVKIKDSFKFFMTDVHPPLGTAKDWSWIGSAPAKYGEATSAAFEYKLNL